MDSTNNLNYTTRQRLLRAASRIFAEKGYQEATVAEICGQAETNIASVNYHFRDKESLYREAWRFAYQQDLERYPADVGGNPRLSVEDRLAGRIRSLIARMADPSSHFFSIVHREMIQQTDLLETIMGQEINPERQALAGLLEELLGPGASPQQIQFCHASIMGQCFHLLKVKHLPMNSQTQEYSLDMADAEAFADHVIKFTLAGIYALREANQRQHEESCWQAR